MPIRTVLFSMSVSPLADENLFAAAYWAVSPERRQKTDRYRMPKDRQLSLGAELLLRYALQGFGISEYHLEYNDLGKPFLRDSNISVSISHSGTYVLCAAADRAVGCDIEQIKPVDLKIAKRFFCPEEYADIVSAPTPEAQTALFYRYWTLKESFMKVTGLGMKLPFNSFRIVHEPQLAVLQSVDENRYGFAEYEGIPGYACALCTVGECREVPLQTVQLSEQLSELKE